MSLTDQITQQLKSIIVAQLQNIPAIQQAEAIKNNVLTMLGDITNMKDLVTKAQENIVPALEDKIKTTIISQFASQTEGIQAIVDTKVEEVLGAKIDELQETINEKVQNSVDTAMSALPPPTNRSPSSNVEPTNGNAEYPSGNMEPTNGNGEYPSGNAEAYGGGSEPMIENTSFTGASMNGGGDEETLFEDVTEEEIAAAIQKGGQQRVHRGRRSRPHALSHKISSQGIEQMASRRSRRSTRRASRKASRKGRRATRKH